MLQVEAAAAMLQVGAAAVSEPAISTMLIVGAGFFALGYLFARRRFLTLSDSGDDDDDNRRSKFAGLLSWIRSTLIKQKIAGDSSERETKISKKKKKATTPLEIEKLAEIIEDFKMVLVVRNDLKMGKGKIAAQCSHATLGMYKKLMNRAPKSLSRWEMCGQVKVVVKIESEEHLLVLQERAKSLHLPAHVTIDAGRTQIAPNSRTVMAILGPADVVDDVTGGLKLL